MCSLLTFLLAVPVTALIIVGNYSVTSAGGLCPGTTVPPAASPPISCFLGSGFEDPYFSLIPSSAASFGLCYSFQRACNNASDAGCNAAGAQQRVYGGGSAADLANLRAAHLGLFSVCASNLCNAPELDRCALPRLTIPDSYTCGAAPLFATPAVDLRCYSTLSAGGAPQNREPTLTSNKFVACLTYDYRCTPADNFTAPWPCFNRTAGLITAVKVFRGLSAEDFAALRSPPLSTPFRNARVCFSSGCNAPVDAYPPCTTASGALQVRGEVAVRAPLGAAPADPALFNGNSALFSALSQSLASSLGLPFGAVTVSHPKVVYAVVTASPSPRVRARRAAAAPAWMSASAATPGVVVGYRFPFSIPAAAFADAVNPALVAQPLGGLAGAVDTYINGARGANAFTAALSIGQPTPNEFLKLFPYENYAELQAAIAFIGVFLFDPTPAPEGLAGPVVAGIAVLATVGAVCLVATGFFLLKRRAARKGAAAEGGSALTPVEAIVSPAALRLRVEPSPYSPSSARAFAALCAAGDVIAVRARLADTPRLIASRCETTGRLPLHDAAAAGHTAVVTLLLAEGAAPDAVDFSGQSALAVAAAGGGPALGGEGVVAALLTKGADANARDAAGRTPLHLAAAARAKGLAALLLSHGADAAALDGAGRTPLQAATAAGAEDVAALLAPFSGRAPTARAGSPPTASTTRHSPRASAKPPPSEVAAFVAGLARPAVDVAGVRAALAANPTLSNATNEEGITALHAATLAGSLPLVDALVHAGANVPGQDATGLSPLAVALRNGRVDVAVYLLAAHDDKAAALAQADNNGLTLLHHAVLSEAASAVKMVLGAGGAGAKGRRDRGGRTPLEVARLIKQETVNTEGSGDVDTIIKLLDA